MWGAFRRGGGASWGEHDVYILPWKDRCCCLQLIHSDFGPHHLKIWNLLQCFRVDVFVFYVFRRLMRRTMPRRKSTHLKNTLRQFIVGLNKLWLQRFQFNVWKVWIYSTSRQNIRDTDSSGREIKENLQTSQFSRKWNTHKRNEFHYKAEQQFLNNPS